MLLADQFTSRDGNRLACEQDAIAAQLDAYDAAARGGLICAHPHFAESLRPVRRERAMRRSGDRIFIDASGGGEEAGDEVVWRCVRASGHDDATTFQLSKLTEIGRDRSNRGFGIDDCENVKRRSKRFDDIGAQR